MTKKDVASEMSKYHASVSSLEDVGALSGCDYVWGGSGERIEQHNTSVATLMPAIFESNFSLFQ